MDQNDNEIFLFSLNDQNDLTDFSEYFKTTTNRLDHDDPDMTR